MELRKDASEARYASLYFGSIVKLGEMRSFESILGQKLKILGPVGLGALIGSLLQKDNALIGDSHEVLWGAVEVPAVYRKLSFLQVFLVHMHKPLDLHGKAGFYGIETARNRNNREFKDCTRNLFHHGTP